MLVEASSGKLYNMMTDPESVLMFVQAQNQPHPPFSLNTALMHKILAILGEFQGDECDAISAIQEN